MQDDTPTGASSSLQGGDKVRPTIPISPASDGHADGARKISELTVADLRSLIAAEVGRVAGPVVRIGAGASHVNSGPPGFVNGGGHANFDPHTAGNAAFSNPADLARVHVNSGPPGFVNGGGHANFDPRSVQGGVVTNPADLARVHVNSGPPGFVNGGGHANFDPKTNLGGRLTNPGDRAGVHVNSGPPGFVNGGGHANFDPASSHGKLTTVTLPGGGQVQIPATGPVNLHVNGIHITR